MVSLRSIPVGAVQLMRSFRQARLSQSICILCSVFRPPVLAQYVLEVGNSQSWINLKQSRHQSLRFLVTPSKRTACGSDRQCAVAIRLLSQCLLCPCQCFIMAASKKMSIRRPCLH